MPAITQAQNDDLITHLLRQSQDSLPVAPAKPGPAPALSPRPAGPAPAVMSARIGEHEDRTRLVIELSDPVVLRSFVLANPARVVLDMPEVDWRLGSPPVPSRTGVIKSYRYGVFRAGSSRMVIDLNRPVTVSGAFGNPALSRLRLSGSNRFVSHL